MGFFGRLFGGCNDRPEDLPDISSASGGGSGDLVLRITESGTGGDGSFRMVARATRRGEIVGFALELGSAWGGDFSKEVGKALGSVLGGMFAGAMGELSLNQGTVTFRSLGPESDRFVGALAQAYEAEAAGAAMKQSVPFAAISMKGDPTRPRSGPVLLKLFFEGGEEGASAELYANIYLRQKTLEVREKDREYRGALLRALTDARR